MKIFLTFMLIFLGIGTANAQRMDERFTDGKLPYGWFTEGWTVQDNAVQSSNGELDISSLLGGGSKSSYLLTPPLNVVQNDSLTFSVKKSGMSFSIGGGSDSIIVEKSVYGSGEWEQVAILKDTLTSSYKPYAIRDVANGEYRFRFTTSASLAIDSVAGHTIDMEAPDLYVTLDSMVVSEVKLGNNMKKDSTTTFIVMNTGTGTLNVNISSSNETFFALSASQLSIAAGDSVTLGVTFKFIADSIGNHQADITFTPTDSRLKAQTVKFSAGIIDPEMWFADFNDGTMPYGCFADGWVLKDSANIQSGSSAGGFDLSSLLGGSSEADCFLLTPPLIVDEANEQLVFAAKSGGGSGIASLLGGGGSTPFYVDRSVYGAFEKWEQVAEFTDSLTSDYKELAVTTEVPGEYRFRFRAASGVVIDSIAGHKLDTEAPDLMVTVDSMHVHTIDLGIVAADSVKQLVVINTATGTLNVDVASSEENVFGLDQKTVAIAAGDSAFVNVSFKYAAAHTGRNEAAITFTPADERVEPQTINITAILEDPNAWCETFNDSIMPEGWFTDKWIVKDSVATLSNAGGSGIGSLLGGSSQTYFLETPPLVVNDATEALTFFVKSGSGGGLGALLGGSGSSLIVERSVYGSNHWEKIKEITDITSDYKQQWVSYAEPGEYRFRFIASDSLVIDSVAGHTLDTNAPDLNVIQGDALVSQLYYSMPKDTATQTITLVNTGTGTLDVNISRSNDIIFQVSSDQMQIAAGDSVDVDVTFVWNEKELGEHNETLFITPDHEGLAQQQIALKAYSIYTDAWTEDFESEYVVDKPDVVGLPEGWETTGWEVSLPGGTLDLGSLLGGGSDDSDKNQTYAASSKSDDYELITPLLQAKKGDVLGFEMEQPTATGDALGSILGESTGDAPTLNMYYSRNGGDWTPCGEYSRTGQAFFTAPYSGLYRLMFKGKDIRLDNFVGFRLPLEEIQLIDAEDNSSVLAEVPDHDVNVNYDRILSATQQSDGTWIPRAFVVSLPYDYDFTDYYEADQAKIFRLAFKEEYYKQFVFLQNSSDNPNFMQAGRAYLVIVTKGQMNLNATAVTITDSIADDSLNVVNSFEDWYFENKFTPVGKWMANFRSITDVEADTLNIYGLRDDGSWARFHSEDGQAKYQLQAFRGYFEAFEASEASEASSQAARGASWAFPMKAPAAPGTYRSLFSITSQQGTSTGDEANTGNLQYEGIIPTIESGTMGIQPTFIAVEADGTSHYFDLQGRMLNGKPVKGLYIEKGKKILHNSRSASKKEK